LKKSSYFTIILMLKNEKKKANFSYPLLNENLVVPFLFIALPLQLFYTFGYYTKIISI